MLDGGLRPRVRAALHLDARAGGGAVTMGDSDLQFRGVPQPLLADIVRRFSGRHTLDAICAHYPEAATRIVRLVTTEMRARGMVLLSRERCEQWPDEASLARGAATWRYVLDRVANPLAAWQCWRNDPVAVGGGGVSFAAAVAGLLDMGVGRLWIAPDTAADRDAVAGLMGDHAARDAAFAWRWLDLPNNPDPAEPAVVTVLVGDSGPVDDTDRARMPDGCLVIAGPAGPGGMVRRLAAGDARSMPSMPADGPPPSRYALAVLGKLAAFQALNAVLVEASGEADVLLPFGPVVRVHADGRTENVAERAPVSIAGGGLVKAAAGAVSPRQRERERWLLAAQPWMAGPSPLLAWDDATPLPVFPLPHRAMTIDVRRQGRPVRLATWAVAPSDVTARTLRRGIEVLADQLTGVGGHAAAHGEAEWRQRAYVAWALEQAPARPARRPAWQLTYDDTGDVEFRTLVRLVSLYLGEVPRVAIGLDSRSGLPRADAAAGGHQRFALATSPLAAATDALGELLSAHQLGLPELIGSAPADGDVVATCHLGLTEIVPVRPERLGLEARLLDVIDGKPAGDLLVGRFAQPSMADG